MEQSTAPTKHDTSEDASASLPSQSADSRSRTTSADGQKLPSVSSATDLPPPASQTQPAPQRQSSSFVPQSPILPPGTIVQLPEQTPRLAFEDIHGQRSSYQSLSLPSLTGAAAAAREDPAPPQHQRPLIPPQALPPGLATIAASLAQPLPPAMIPFTAAPTLTSAPGLQLESGMLIFPLGQPGSVVGSGLGDFTSQAPIILGPQGPFVAPLPTPMDLLPFMPLPDNMVQPPLPVIIDSSTGPGAMTLAQPPITLEQVEEQTGVMDMDISTTPLDTPKDAPSTPQHTPVHDSTASQLPPKDDLATLPRAQKQDSSVLQPELVEQMEEQTGIMDMDISTTPLDTPKHKPSTPQLAPKDDSATLQHPRPDDLTMSPKQDPSALPYSPTDEPTTSPYSPTKEPIKSPLYSPTYDPLSPSSVDFSYSPPSSPPDIAALEASEMSLQQTSTVQGELPTCGSRVPSPGKGATSKSLSASQVAEASASGASATGDKSTRHSMDEKQQHSIAEPAVASHNIQKRALILRAEQEVKFAIRKYVSSREISTEEYKYILKHAVKKICSSTRTGINPRVIGQFIERYVESVKRRRWHSSTKHKD
ncbi:PHD and RING finger domain-containing protein 1-like [Dermacentor albipictus]|uniref:PHD and RING finger domain-containing protein 1-like n=1 Tax=Dermacentor albipictus TaxID=60249 RepID=UPI0031FCFA57